MLSLLSIPLIGLPMAYEPLRKRMAYELRKGLHMGFALVFGISICFHAPQMHIAYIMGFTMALYLADLFVVMFFRTFKIETTHFHRLERGVQVTFPNPAGFNASQTGYVYINIPWIETKEWHAFSLYPHPKEPETKSCVCISVGGDWTAKLHRAVEYDTKRPSYICGPFTSPYATATSYDNLCLVASGIGITPAVSIIQSAKEERRCNLIWMTRDASMIEFYLANVEFDDDAFTTIYYTGKRKLVLDIDLPPTVLIFHHRPNLDACVRGMIHGIETGSGLPETMVAESAAEIASAEAAAAALDVADDADPVERVRAVVLRALMNSTVDVVYEQFLVDGMGSKDADELTAQGVQTVVALHGVDLKTHEAQAVVDHFDTDGDGTISAEEFKDFCDAAQAFLLTDDDAAKEKPLKKVSSADSLCDNVAIHVKDDGSPLKPLKKVSSTDSLTALFGNASAEESAADVVDGKQFMADVGERLHTWQILYCGGAQPVVDQLQKIHKTYGIAFRKEKFDW